MIQKHFFLHLFHRFPHRSSPYISLYPSSSPDLGASIQENFDALLNLAPGKAPAEEVAALRKRIEEDQALLIQWAEEKVQLALTGHELLDTQMAQLETDLASFRDELGEQGIEVGEGYVMDDYPMDVAPPEPVGRRSGGARLGYGYDSLEPQASLGVGVGGGGGVARKSTQIPLSLSRQQSGYGSEGGYGTGSEAMGWDAARRGGGVVGGGGAGRRASAAVPDPGYNSRRRAASAAVHATAVAVAALDEDDGGYGAPAAPGAGPVPGEQAPVLEPYVPGLQHFSKSPQAPGRPLEEGDISPALVGRIAEVFWPDEANPTASMWYLVKIETVNMVTKTAVIRYQNGEMEPDLSLVDVARDQHMMLVTM
jgi:hypothetical protein